MTTVCHLTASPIVGAGWPPKVISAGRPHLAAQLRGGEVVKCQGGLRGAKRLVGIECLGGCKGLGGKVTLGKEAAAHPGLAACSSGGGRGGERCAGGWWAGVGRVHRDRRCGGSL